LVMGRTPFDRTKVSKFQHNSHKPGEVSSVNLGFFIFWVNYLTSLVG
jgi:hypothetical protein